MQSGLVYALAFAPALAELVGSVQPEALARYGLLGAVLAWFMMRADKRLGGIEHKMAGLNRTMLIEIMSRSGTSDRAKQLCRAELKLIDPELAAEFGGE